MQEIRKTFRLVGSGVSKSVVSDDGGKSWYFDIPGEPVARFTTPGEALLSQLVKERIDSYKFQVVQGDKELVLTISRQRSIYNYSFVYQTPDTTLKHEPTHGGRSCVTNSFQDAWHKIKEMIGSCPGSDELLRDLDSEYVKTFC